jgi:aldose 1-epimerase
VPGIGFNCYSFEVPGRNGPIETLWCAPGFLDGKARPSSSGIPILFPFAGRIRGTSFEYEGRRFELAPGDGQGNAIHGFALDRPWRVTRQEANLVRGEFQASVDEPAIVDRWPADYRIAVEYQVKGSSLVADISIENPDARTLPFGFGTHPYFQIPLGGSSGADCRVRVGVQDDWELVGLLPTGRKTASPLAQMLARGDALASATLDNVFSGIDFTNHRATATIEDPHSGRKLSMSFDDQFAACVVYTPPHREAVCIEPYTTIPDPFSLMARGVDAKLRTLAPGKSMKTRIEIAVD